MGQAGEDTSPWDRPRSSAAASSPAHPPAVSGSTSVSAQAPASLVPCPVPTLIHLPATATPGAKQRFCSAEGKLGEKSLGAQGGGECEGRSGEVS